MAMCVERQAQRHDGLLDRLGDRCYFEEARIAGVAEEGVPTMPDQLFVFILIGFFAQIVDGALGMAFGVLCTTSLLAFGVAPAAASAMTHVTELFTTAASGASHVYHRNIDWHLVWRLAPAGMLGGAAGAILLANVDGAAIAPYVSAYLATMGGYIALRSLWPREVPRSSRMEDPSLPFVALTVPRPTEVKAMSRPLRVVILRISTRETFLSVERGSASTQNQGCQEFHC